MNFKAKSIIKKVALVLAGVTAITAAGFGVKALVDYTKDDLKTITPTFEVGNLGSDGKFVDDKSTLYTKEAFEAEGLQIKLDFDSQINYQIFYYDDLDNFVESTAVLSSAYSDSVHDGYARIVIIPTDDEDEKISLVERVTYPGQMTIKVNKEQDVEYINLSGKRLMVVDNVANLRFCYGSFDAINGSWAFIDDTLDHTVTSKDILTVKEGQKISLNYTSSTLTANYSVIFFSVEKGNVSYISNIPFTSDDVVVPSGASLAIIKFVLVDSDSSFVNINSTMLNEINSYFTLTNK